MAYILILQVLQSTVCNWYYGIHSSKKGGRMSRKIARQYIATPEFKKINRINLTINILEIE